MRRFIAVLLCLVLLALVACMPSPTAGPLLDLPANITVGATAEAGALVSYSTVATNASGESLPATCDQAGAAGGWFPIGTTTVTCSASNDGVRRVGWFTVTVEDRADQVEAEGILACSLMLSRALRCWTTGTAFWAREPMVATTARGHEDIADLDVADAGLCSVRRDGTLWCSEPSFFENDGDPPYYGTAGQIAGIEDATRVYARVETIQSTEFSLLELRWCVDRRDNRRTCLRSVYDSDGYYAGTERQTIAIPPPVPTDVVQSVWPCKRRQNGTVSCQIGNPEDPDTVRDREMDELRGASTIAASSEQVCGALESIVRCVALSDFGVTDTALGPVRSLAVGGSQACVITMERETLCWAVERNERQPIGVPTPSGAVRDVAITRNAVCAAIDTPPGADTLWCWGGAIGLSLPYPPPNLVPVALPTPGRIVKIAAGGSHVCGILDDGRVVCWGNNNAGQLGNGTRQNAEAPTLVPDLTGVVDIAVSKDYWADSCALRSDGRVACWGDRTGSLSPVDVVGISDAIAISIGVQGSCALRVSGSVTCWDDPAGPLRSMGVDQVTAISGSCALRLGAVLCWAFGRDGIARLFPVGLSDATAIGEECAVISGTAVRCWYRRVSIGDDPDYLLGSPTEFVGATSVQGSLFGHRCAIDSGGALSCWGSPIGNFGRGPSMPPVAPYFDG